MSPRTTTESESDDDAAWFVGAPADLVRAFELVLAEVQKLVRPVALSTLAGMRGRVEAAETLLLAELIHDPDDTRAADRAQRDPGASRADRRRRSKRAATAKRSPNVGAKVADGSLGGSAVDEIARADRQSDGAASVDDELVDAIAAAGADKARSIVDDWLARRRSEAQVRAEHERHRRLRSVRRFTTRDGLHALMAEGDTATIAEMWKALNADADAAYQAAGGRDVPDAEHAATHRQRLYDALHRSITGTAQRRECDRCGDSLAAAAVGLRSQLMIVFDAERLFGDRSQAELAELLGEGPIADAAAARYIDHADIICALVKDGQPLWMGRAARQPNRSQLRALMLRDKGCVLCGAAPERCQAHHCIPWNSPARGPTDIDSLAMVCTDCHHRLHERHQTLVFEPDAGVWRLRPARPDEVPPNKPRDVPQRE